MICNLQINDDIYTFACTILFKLIKKAISVKFNQLQIFEIIKSYFFNDKLHKLGYSCDTGICLKVFEYANSDNFENFIKLNKSNNITFMQIMGALYKFQVNNEFVLLCIERDRDLTVKFIDTVRRFFKVPESFSFQDCKDIITASDGKWFYLWILTFLENDTINLFHRNVGTDEDYIRKWNFSPTEYNFELKEKREGCLNKQFDNYKEFDMIIGNTFLTPRLNGFWSNIMNKYKKQIIAGPSGSSALLYQILFKICKVLDPSVENKSKTLLCIIADYYKYFHSISEVLQIYPSVAELPTYTLDMDEVDYINEQIIPSAKLTIFGGNKFYIHNYKKYKIIQGIKGGKYIIKDNKKKYIS